MCTLPKDGTGESSFCCDLMAMLCYFIPAGPDDEYDLLVANGEYIYTVHFNGSNSDVVRNEPGERNIGVDVHFGLEIVLF